MKKIAFVALAVTLSSLLGGCLSGPQIEEQSVFLAANPGEPDLPLCRWIEPALRGREALVFKVKDQIQEDMVAFDVDGEIVCVEESTAALMVGIIAVDNGEVPACDICDGEPMPAQKFNEDARKFTTGLNDR